MKAKGWGLPFGGECDSEHVLRGTRWADSYWLFCDNRERLIRMVNDTMEELLDLDEAPKQESLWWTGTHKHEDMKTLRVGSRGKIGDLPFREVFEVLGYDRDGKGECTLCKGFGKYKNRSRTVPMTTTCRRVHSQACSTASEWQHQLAMEWGHDQQGTCLGSEDTTSHLQASFQAG